MHCMRCGAEIAAEQFFCEDCRANMEKHPVKPDTPVVLPPKAFTAPPKRTTHHHHRPRRQEESPAKLRIKVRILAALCAVLLIGLALCGSLIAYLLTQEEPAPSAPDPGQNYSTGSVSTVPTTVPTTVPSTGTEAVEPET